MGIAFANSFYESETTDANQCFCLLASKYSFLAQTTCLTASEIQIEVYKPLEII